MPDFGIFRGFGDKLIQGQTPTQLGAIGSQNIFDSDALAYFDRVTVAGGTLSSVEQNAVNSLVIDIKALNIWTKIKALYPLVGSSAAACSQNLKSASFAGTFYGGWTFASTGATPNGTTGYFDTLVNPNTTMVFNDQSYSVYKNGLSSSYEFGTVNAGYNGVAMGLTSGVLYSVINEFILNNPFTSNTANGFYTLNRVDSSEKKLFRNGALFETKTSAATSYNVGNIYMAGRERLGISDVFGSGSFRFFSIGDGLTDTEAVNFYTAVQTFQTALSRNV
jgi:hypothetical protein